MFQKTTQLHVIEEITYETPTAVDICSEFIILIDEEITTLGCTGNYTIKRTFSAEDECGNVATDVQVITVEDTVPPILTIPADYSGVFRRTPNG